MWKNYMLAALNVAVAGLPFLVGWDLVLYGVYCGFAVLLLGLTAWNPVGTDHAGATTVSSGGYIRKRLFKAKMQVLLCRKPNPLLYPYQPEAGGSFPGSGRLLDPRL